MQPRQFSARTEVPPGKPIEFHYEIDEIQEADLLLRLFGPVRDGDQHSLMVRNHHRESSQDPGFHVAPQCDSADCES